MDKPLGVDTLTLKQILFSWLLLTFCQSAYADIFWLFREADLDNTRGYWVGGMFMGFRSSVFREIGGFDERYFMYLEDVDICAELLAAGYEVAIDADNKVTHDARRGSRRNLTLFFIHCASYIKYFIKWRGKSFG